MPKGTDRLPDIIYGAPIYSARRLGNLLIHCGKRSSQFFKNRSFPLKLLGDGSRWRLAYGLNQEGFTLVDLFIAAAMIGVLATIAVPNILIEMPKFRLNGATRQVLGDMMTARMRAVSQNKKVKVIFTDGNQYQICDDPFDLPCWKNFRIQDNFKGISIDTGNNPIFQPRGTASPMTVSIRNSRGCIKNIKINITGRIRIDSPPCS